MYKAGSRAWGSDPLSSSIHLTIGATESHASPVGRSLGATIVRNPADILALSGFVSGLAAEPGMLAPRFFLASLISEPFKPCVVVVEEDTRVAGLVYCKERHILGIPTGIVVADDTLGAMVAAHPDETDSVMRCALRALLKRKSALRWRLPAERVPMLLKESAAAGFDVHFRREGHHGFLQLPAAYSDFLAGLHRSTRHNLNRYRRRSEEAGDQFCSELDFAAFCAAAERLLPQSAYRLTRGELQRSLAMLAEMPSRQLVGIRQSNGAWISLAGLWCTGDRAFMAIQLNDRRLMRESVSVVLRSCLIEDLIGRGFRTLVFLDGVSKPLSSYTDTREEVIAYIDSRSPGWRLVRHGCIVLGRLAPTKFANWERWRDAESLSPDSCATAHS